MRMVTFWDFVVFDVEPGTNQKAVHGFPAPYRRRRSWMEHNMIAGADDDGSFPT